MYAALWHILPGPIWLRVVTLTVLLAGVLVVCLTLVFPWLNSFINATEVTVKK
ncbi:MAG: hypothetical protein H7248_07010 [Microbacteriaceae bacterium]|nr:hypothetical protein [Microbacteriaceae bacterium]